mmetsp:Transcript_131204/g.420193  ORF Transcript_131204/g.420193 Transcript_131204/m.420193 type:complete len:135 (+) Transcript_131204:1-405(+)
MPERWLNGQVQILPGVKYVVLPEIPWQMPIGLAVAFEQYAGEQVFFLNASVIHSSMKALRRIYASDWFDIGKKKGESPTSGFTAMLLAMTFCDEATRSGPMGRHPLRRTRQLHTTTTIVGSSKVQRAASGTGAR